MKFRTTEVFTPQIPAKYTFIEREQINDRLVDSLNTPGKQLVVYGHSGSGKTTLITNKLSQIYEEYLITRCTEATTIEQLIFNAFDKLNAFYIESVGGQHLKVN